MFINSVDAQSSVNGGIIIQVIGEMSNNAEAWKKFAQTFFLAEQPNGYFVLNDIFRYLKEEAVDTEEMDGAEQIAPAEPETAAPFTTAVPPIETAAEPVAEESITTQPAAIEEEDVQPKVNGISHAEPAATEPEPQPAEPATPEPVREPTPLPEEPAPVEEPAAPEEPAQPTPPPAADPTPPAPAPSQPSPAAAPAPAQPQAPPAPKTWANLAAANSNKWGNAVAQEAKGVSASVAPASPLPSGATTPSRDGRTTPARVPKGDRDSQPPAFPAAMAVTTAQCFVKVGFDNRC